MSKQRLMNPQVYAGMRALRKAGFVAGLFGRRGDRGWGRVLRVHKEQPRRDAGAVFYSREAVAAAHQTGRLYLQWGYHDMANHLRQLGDEQMQPIAERAVSILREAGCDATWSGFSSGCIIIEDAARPRPSHRRG